MKNLITTLFVTGIITTAAFADDVDDVKAAEMAFNDAENAGDWDEAFLYLLPDRSVFGSSEGFLTEGWTEEVKATRKARFAAGYRIDLQIRHLDAKVYGNTAVTTFYRIGTVTRPGGVSQQVSGRITGVWAKQSGQWQLVHRHQSPLVLSQPPKIEERFVGTWRFVSIERRGPDGEAVPFENPFTSGLIMYTPTGHMSVQLMRGERQEYAGDRPTDEEAQAALGSYIAYYGPFTVNEAEGTVTHHRQAHLNPGSITDATRYYKFSGNRLMLTPVPSGETTVTLTWERVE